MQQNSFTPSSRRHHVRPRSGHTKNAFSLHWLYRGLFCVLGSLALVYVYVLGTFWVAMTPSNDSSLHNDGTADTTKPQKQIQQEPQRSYADWRKIAVNLAKLPPEETLATLERDDPFGVRRWSSQVTQLLADAASESAASSSFDYQAVIQRIQQQDLFSCPPTTHRLSLPDQRQHDKAQAFRNGQSGTFIFFQHLRKAGGTNVCTLATENLSPQHLPPYYCMPDYHWHRPDDAQQHGTNGCAGCLHHWRNDEIIQNMGPYRIAGNEWDSFDPTRHLDLPAVLITSFRRPLDRALSQFRFECLEHRGCHFDSIEPWWEKRRDLYNVYTWTFSDVRQGRLATSTRAADIAQRSEAVGLALDVLMQFHLILILEYLPLAAPLVGAVLNFTDTSVLTRHVRPHNGQIQRQDSLLPKDFLSTEQYRRMSETLALDEILTDAAQRLFWERLVCETY